MNKKDIYTLGLLIILTALIAIFSTYFSDFTSITFIILSLSIIKFLLIAFNFMELKKAHSFWRVLIIIFLILFVGIISISL